MEPRFQTGDVITAPWSTYEFQIVETKWNKDAFLYLHTVYCPAHRAVWDKPYAFQDNDGWHKVGEMIGPGTRVRVRGRKDDVYTVMGWRWDGRYVHYDLELWPHGEWLDTFPLTVYEDEMEVIGE